jgi:redox-sensitive bicupin YhaK (pirin superfamily)
LVVPATVTTEGEGVIVHRPFPGKGHPDADPFLLLDHLGPVTMAPGRSGGFPDHPHAGFEVVSYVLQGGLEHRDSRGNHGILGPGDVQWMTAGAGLVHSEMPAGELAVQGGVLEAVQLWVNLPAREKRSEPRYGDVRGDVIPVATTPDGRASVRVIAGESHGARHALGLRTSITYLHWTVEPGARVEQPLPEGTVALAYVLGGLGGFGPAGTRGGADSLVLFDGDRGPVLLESAGGPEALSVLVLAGVALREPVARYGPFVMNTMEEIKQLITAYRGGAL